MPIDGTGWSRNKATTTTNATALVKLAAGDWGPRAPLPLELGQCCEDTEHEAAGRGRGVDLRALAGEHPQAHAAGRQVLHLC